MDNNYESLLDERFQMLCQSLLTLEYPGVQCMPVGMPDGGRDALVRGRSGGSTLVYQIKYTRDPSGVEDRAQWVIDAISKELPKVARLAEAGDVERYVIMTNMPGTSHLKSGSIDRVQAFLDENSPVPSICLWRHDIDMRLDPHIQLKLRYPSLISGQDAIRLLWHLGGGERK